MKAPKSILTLAGGAALSLSLLVGTAHAESMMSEEQLEQQASELQQAIEANPQLGQYPLDITSEDGKLVVTGMIEDLDDYNDLQGIIDGMEGADNIENNIVRN